MMSFKVVELTSDLLTTHFDDFVTTLYNLAPSDLLSAEKAQTILQKIQQQGTHVFVALHEDGHLVGSISLLLEQKFLRGGKIAGHLEDVVTRKGYEGQGIASALIQQAIAQAHQSGCYKIILDCDEELTNFYTKFGFQKDSICMKQYCN